MFRSDALYTEMNYMIENLSATLLQNLLQMSGTAESSLSIMEPGSGVLLRFRGDKLGADAGTPWKWLRRGSDRKRALVLAGHTSGSDGVGAAGAADLSTTPPAAKPQPMV